MKYSVRPYNNEDFDSVIDILKLTNLYIPFTDTKEIFSQKSKDDPETILVAEKNGEVLGFTLISYDIWASTIRHMCSHPTKGKGAGFYLALKTIKIIKSRGCKLICSYTETSNNRSMKFQKLAGWKPWKDSSGRPMNVYCMYKKY